MRTAALPPDNKGGDAAFFDTIYAAHRRVIYAYLLGHIHSADVAADLLQETYLRVWRHLEDARQVPGDRMRYWLLAIARNLILDQRRRQETRQRYEEAARLCAASQSDPVDPAHVLMTKETAAAVDAAIAQLPDTLRLVLTLHLVGDMTSAEIGRCLERPAGTVRYQIARARRLVAQQLNLWNENSEGRKPEEL